VLLFMCLLNVFSAIAAKDKVREVDVCVYGGTSSGVIAAYTAKQMGKSVVLVEPGKHLGGMSSGGLGYTDIGNKYVVKGLALDFYRRLGSHYGKLEQWIFEPKVAEAIFNDYAARAGFAVWLQRRLHNVIKKGNTITQIIVEDTNNPVASTYKTIKAKVFIDCSHEGDLMAQAKVSYAVGRESNSLYNETYNGVQLLNQHQFPDGIDPFIVRGDSTSGLIWGINSKSLAANGSGDKKVQAYNFRVTLTNVKANLIPITIPDNYDPKKYELLIRLKEKIPWERFYDVFIWCSMPNGKTDINNKGGFSTDMIGGSWNYPEATYDERARIIKVHEDYTKGLFYFIGHDERIPERIRKEMLQWGYPKDEFIDNNNWTPQLYVRESRRMIGELVMNQHHCKGDEIINDGIGMAAYTMDSHNCDRVVVNGMVKNEGNVEVGGFPPYPISYRALVPQKKEVNNLLVPFCMSASHIAYGSIRMEPVFMVLAQSAAIAACLSIDENKGVVQDVNVAKIQDIFKNNPLADGSVPDIVVDNNDKGNVILTGDWKLEGGKAYGSNFLSDNSKGVQYKSIKYKPNIIQKGEYEVFVFYPKMDDITTQTSITIFDGYEQNEKLITAKDIIIEGQTSGEWVSVGNYNFPEGKNGYVEISNKNSDGRVIADAVLFIKKGKNI